MLVRWGSWWHLPTFAVLFPVLEVFLLFSAYWMLGPITPDPWWEGKRVTSHAPLARTEFLGGEGGGDEHNFKAFIIFVTLLYN